LFERLEKMGGREVVEVKVRMGDGEAKPIRSAQVVHECTEEGETCEMILRVPSPVRAEKNGREAIGQEKMANERRLKTPATKTAGE
jgi:hypothetical protein